LIATLTPHLVRRYTVKYDFPSKKAAKTAVAIAAIEQGLIDMAKQVKEGLHSNISGDLVKFKDLIAQQMPGSKDSPYLIQATPRGFPEVHEHDDLPRLEVAVDDLQPLSAASYSTFSNKRPIPILELSSAYLDRQIASPPPYSAGRTSESERQVADTQTASPLPVSAAGAPAIPSPQSWTSQQDFSEGLADQPLLRFLNQRADAILGSKKAKHLLFDIRRDVSAGQFGGTVTLLVDENTKHAFQVPFASPTAKMASEAAATKALDGGIVSIMERTWPEQRSTDKTDTNALEAEQNSAHARPDPHAQAVSYLQQICQQLLGVEAEDRPKYELLKKGQGCMLLSRNCTLHSC